MHSSKLAVMAGRLAAGKLARQAGPDWLAAALRASREDTLYTFGACERALDSLSVPHREALNPPLWELGHIGWFQEFWIARNPQREIGTRADPEAPRLPGIRADADTLYNSSRVAHAARWRLPLPNAATTRSGLASQLDATLGLLATAADDDAALYFFRLALLHEDMHHEAALYMAQSLGVEIDDVRWQPSPLDDACDQLTFDAGTWQMGSDGMGFAFDNELDPHPVMLPTTTRIDSRVLRWADYLPFVEAGGYDEGEPDNEATLLAAIREGAVLRVRPKAMTVAIVLAGLIPMMWGHGTGSEIMARVAAPMVGGMVTAPLLSMLVIPAAWFLLRRSRGSHRAEARFPDAVVGTTVGQ